MVKRLQVSVGPDRFNLAVASINRPSHPTIINTPLFVGRVLVQVKHFTGVLPTGEEGDEGDETYFEGRSRKFSILIEGRFKGEKPYSGDEVHFGTDFDFLPESFPHAPFNAGMRIAKYIDPATFYEENPPSGRPYIMSPYLACMNTFCAYPSPPALHKALLLAHHDQNHLHHEGEELEDDRGVVPLESLVGQGKGKREERDYWRFVGLLGTPAVDAFARDHTHLLNSPLPSEIPLPIAEPLPSGTSLPQHQSLGTKPSMDFTIGVDGATGRASRDDKRNSGSSTPRSGSPGFGALWGAPIPASSGEEKVKKPSKSRFSLATLLGGGKEEEYLHKGDLIRGNRLLGVQMGEGSSADEVEMQLGPWRFGEPGVDALEDTTFVFLDPSHTRSVAARRKYFCEQDGKNRKEFFYDPEIVYAASFFTNFCDLNTFDLKMGPLNLNIATHFTDQPIRYTLRSTRLIPSLDPLKAAEGIKEEECFVTIAFQLVDMDE